MSTALLAACDDFTAAPPEAQTGSLRATITTAGSTLDANGYTLIVDTNQRAVAVQDTVTVTGLSIGPHTVGIAGLASNCTASEPASATLEIGASAQATIAFDVACDSMLMQGVVFARISAGTFTTYWVSLTGGPPVFLLNGGSPAVSPNGRQIAYECGPWLCLMNVDGTNRVLLTTELSGQPSWSPDGRQLAFVRYQAGGDLDIYRIRSDGTGEYPVTNGPGEDHGPVWSPDGTQIAFTRSTPQLPGIWIIHPDGTGETPVTQAIDRSDEVTAWAPTPERLLITRTGPSPVGNRIVSIALDGSDPREIGSGLYDEYAGSWAPGSQGLVFVSTRVSPAAIFRADSNGANVQQLTSPDSGTVDYRPHWLP
jgi:hypothetical protein